MRGCRMNRCFYCRQPQAILLTRSVSGFFSGHLRVMLRSLLFQETVLPHWLLPLLFIAVLLLGNVRFLFFAQPIQGNFHPGL